MRISPVLHVHRNFVDRSRRFCRSNEERTGMQRGYLLVNLQTWAPEVTYAGAICQTIQAARQNEDRLLSDAIVSRCRQAKARGFMELDMEKEKRLHGKAWFR